jgi:hypothetical protein
MPEKCTPSAEQYARPVTVSDDGLTFTCTAHKLDPRVCDECADAWVYRAYVNLGTGHIETFGGHALARIISHRLGKRRLTPSGGSWRPAYVRALAPGTSRVWHGTYNYDGGSLIRLHRK